MTIVQRNLSVSFVKIKLYTVYTLRFNLNWCDTYLAGALTIELFADPVRQRKDRKTASHALAASVTSCSVSKIRTGFDIQPRIYLITSSIDLGTANA